MQRFFYLLFFVLTSKALLAQTNNNQGSIMGSYQSDFQYYVEDKGINAIPPPEKIGFNNYLKLDYQLRDFRVGMRYEHYSPPLLGYPTTFNGTGIANRYITYRRDGLEVTAGNFYAQFGSGMALRAQEQRQLGIDNSIDGLMLKYILGNKASITALTGKQRDGFNKSEGTIRGVDAEIYVHEFFPKDSLAKNPIKLTIAGSIVSRFQSYNGSISSIPNQTEVYAGRFLLIKGDFNISGEYVRKTDDPSALNNYKQGKGNAGLLNVSYSIGNLSANVSAKRIDNMDFRADRTAVASRLWTNYVPANTLQHTYRLLTLYPYAVQTLGETAIQADVSYAFKKGTLIGGQFGAELAVNYSLVHNIDSNNVLAFGKRTYYQDANIEITKKISKKLFWICNHFYRICKI